MTNQQLFIRKAIKLALENVRDGKGGPFAAIVIKGDKVIASGANLVTSTNDPTAHGEIIAIREACKVMGTFRLDGCEMYTSCEPCPMCLGAIYWARLSRVYFANTMEETAEAGFDDKMIFEEIHKPIGERTIPIIKLAQNESLAAFKEWKGKKDKIKY